MNEAILILLNGIDENANLKASSMLRCQAGMSLFNGHQHIVISTGYTVNKKPVLKDDGFPAFEAEVAANYLLASGVPQEKIWIETFSKDTIGNIYFSKLMHLDMLQVDSLSIVTSKFHMQRTKLIAEWVFGFDHTRQIALNYHEAEDPDYPTEVITALVEKEKKSCANLEKLRTKITDNQAFHKWLFTEHQAYTMNGKAEKLNNLLIKTY